MLCFENSQPTEEFMVDNKDGTSCTYSAAAFQDAQDIEESAGRVNQNQDQYQPEKKTPEATFII